MVKNRVKRVWREGKMALAAYSGSFCNPTIVEVIGLAGFDAVFIDLEHMPFDLRDVQSMVIMCERMDITPMVRVPGFDPAFILRLLDMGVQGIYVPDIDGIEAARKAVEACYYPPLGDRGMMPIGRCAEFGRIPLPQYMEQANDEVLLCLMIEGLKALDEIDEIAALKGVDLIAVGPTDMSRALGVIGQPDHPKLVAAMNRVAEAVKKSNNARLSLPTGFALYPRTIKELRDMGVAYTNIAPSPDVRLLKSYTQSLTDLRKELGQ
jgi:4-hydroxy-2-oxoheptanedioate aldolase